MTEDGGDGRVQVSSAQACPPGGEGPALSGADPAFSAGLITGIMLPSTFGYGSKHLEQRIMMYMELCYTTWHHDVSVQVQYLVLHQ